MQSVFIAGSITIKKLPEIFREKLEGLIVTDLKILIGDANGVDSAVQAFLHDRRVEPVTVFCTGSVPRNNIGSWPVETIVSAAEPGTKAFFTAKDLAMAERADLGLMLWDAKSTGTLTNVFELLRRGKKSIVFLNKHNIFWIVRDHQSLLALTEHMSIGAREQAEKKIGLSSRLRKLERDSLPLLI